MQNQHSYFFVNLKGAPYQIGMQQAEVIKTIPPLKQFITSLQPEWSRAWYAEAEVLYRRACPGLMEEIQGLADGLKVSPQQIFYHFHTYLIPPRCSHAALLPRLTANRRTLVARSYEFNPDMEDKRLCLTKPEGKFGHLGFSCLVLGRLDGMNDQGLVVTMSAGGFPVGANPNMRTPVQKGLQFWAVIRSILENCRYVEEGLAWLKEIPCGGNPILILADKSGKAAKAEVFGPQVSVESVDSDSPLGYVCATNHFTCPDLEQFSSPPMHNSVVRRQTILDLIDRCGPSVQENDLRGMLSTVYPQGLCHHFYKEFFGTLYSLIADPLEGRMDVCFGSPAVNPWTSFTLDETAPFKMFNAELPQADGFAGFMDHK